MIRQNASGVTMDLDDFQALDYGAVCQMLGLRPSLPKLSAEAVQREASVVKRSHDPKRRRTRGLVRS
jgi:hypothetical protein